MKGLDEIKIKKTHSVIIKGSNGIPTKKNKTVYLPLKIKTIDAGLRFVHYIIDSMVVNGILMLISFFVIAASISANDMNFIELIFIPLQFLSFIILPAYYILMEGIWGITLGKLATGYIVIDNFANKPSFGSIVARSFCRIVPFEPFSCLGTPSLGWHDKWSKTYVVHKSEVPKLKAIIEKFNQPDEEE